MPAWVLTADNTVLCDVIREKGLCLEVVCKQLGFHKCSEDGGVRDTD